MDTLPPFLIGGDLPAEVYVVTLREALNRFGVESATRRNLAIRLERAYRLASGTGHLRRFIVFGSFVTSKPKPNDVDIFIIMDDAFKVDALSGEARMLFDHGAAQALFGCSVFWLRSMATMNGEESAIEDWRIKRDGTKRGILEIKED